MTEYAEIHFVDAAVLVSEEQQKDNLGEEGENIQPDVIVTHSQVKHVEVYREVVPRIFPE